MKTNLKHILLVILALVIALPLAAAPAKKKKKQEKYRPYDIHNLAMWGGVGYSGLLNSYDMGDWGEHKFIGGGGGLLGVGYEYHYKKFLLHVGPELRLFTSQDNLTFNKTYDIAGRDYPDYQTLHYDFSYNAEKPEKLLPLKQTQTIGQVMLPVMFGATFDKVYFMAGAKIGYTLFAPYTQKGSLTTTFTDNAAWEDWFEVTHGTATNVDYKSKGKNTFGLDYTVSAEVGLVLDDLMPEAWRAQNDKQKHPWHMRVAAFVDYGIPNINISEGLAFATPTNAGITDAGYGISTESLHSTEWATGRVNSLLVGVKFTALLQLNKPKAPKPQAPRMAARVTDEETGNPIQGAKVNVVKMSNKRKAVKTTDKNGMFIQRYPADNYELTPTKAGYITPEPVLVQHEEDLRDTVQLTMRPEPYFSCVVYDSKTNEVIKGAIVNFFDKKENKETHFGATDSISGNLRIKLKYQGQYRANISATGYVYKTIDIADAGVATSFYLDPIEKRTYVIENLFFASNQTVILPTSESALQELFDFLNDNPDVRIRITGHTDNIGTDEDNQILSEGRSASVKQSMVDRGINPDRIETEGKGESEPRDTNDTEEGRQNNRRVEFTIL